MKNLFGKLSLVGASLLLPLTIFIGMLANWWYKANNPDNVNIAHGLAYIKPLMTTAIIIFVVVIIFSLVTALMGFKKDADKSFVKLSLVLLGIAIVLSVSSALINQRIDAIEEEYTKQQLEKYQLPFNPFTQEK